MRNTGGLTLVEVVLAILILAVGIIGAGAMQANGLRATRTSQIVQELDAAARSAIASLRLDYQLNGKESVEALDCPENFDELCTYTAVPCSLSAGELQCAVGTTAEVAWAVTVTASGQDHEVVLNTIVMTEAP